jgi:hypothetical protein
MPELTRPSTANSDAVSVTGSDIGGANPFDLERHASLYYQPPQLGIREPSIYVSDDSDFARMAKATTDDNNDNNNNSNGQPMGMAADFGGGHLPHPNGRSSSRASTTHSRSTSYDEDSYSVNDYDSSTEYLTMINNNSASSSMSITDRRSRQGRTRTRSQSNASVNSQLQHPRVAAMNGGPGGMMMDYSPDAYGGGGGGGGGGVPPAPPSARVMQGAASREMVRDEVMRLLASFSSQLGATNAYVSALPVRTGRRGSEAYAG